MPVGHPFLDLETPLVIGHRGAAGEMPENTLASFARGLADGAVILETDAHLTRDGEVVLIHDDAVDRISEGTGPVREYRLADLQRLDAGYRFARAGAPGHPERGRGHRIPTLGEVLDALPGARVNIELKEDVPGIVERTLEVLARAGRLPLALLTSADDALMARIRALVEAEGIDVALGACTGEVADFARAAAVGAPPRPGVMALQIPTHFGRHPLVTPELVAHAHRHGVQVHVWTINDPDEMRSLLDLEVDGIISDHPARLRDVVAERRRA
jgi:glycerophosphoryl diester phosphodiesterase